MAKISHKIALPIILAGAFVAVMLVSIDYEQLSLSSYIILALLFVFVFFFGFTTGQNLSSPVQKILNRAIDLSKGDLKTRVYLETKDELAELAKAFNQIAEKLEQSQLNEEQTEKSVDIKVRAKTKALEETINALDQKIRNRTIELEKISKSSETLQAQTKEKEKQIEDLKQELEGLKPKKPAKSASPESEEEKI